jgi:hypothetical protein
MHSRIRFNAMLQPPASRTRKIELAGGCDLGARVKLKRDAVIGAADLCSKEILKLPKER